ncbi:zinc finger protein 600-like [Asbolus verrucosus]|uniref:Zinc finger protein 600-like n=1 Tax=Asbolus verrucosus TaxID=1661398 RepID=A0A482VIR8_ASBVE|nr:zinc finger protein 600-like [Asbolus verrucosus]
MMDEHLITESEIKIEEDEINDSDYSSSNHQKSTFSVLPRSRKSKPRKFTSPKNEKVTSSAEQVEQSWKEYLKLENSLQTYYCTQCSFETKWKCYLKNHIKKIHASPEEARMYHCMQCKFKTKWKFSLSNHMKVHSAPGTLKMHKCPKCNYQTKWNNGLSSHMKVHMLPKVMKVNLYKCTECSYESKNKLDLAQHVKMCHSPLQTVYKCPLCTFQTKFRHGVNKHVKVHNTAKLNVIK